MVSTVERTSYYATLLELHLSAAWMRHCGPELTPGEWIPGGYLPVIENDEPEVSVYPMWAWLDDTGQPRGWSGSMNPAQHNVVPCWSWSLDVGWDDLEQAQIDRIEDIGGCFDDHTCDFMILGAHDQRPPIPTELIQTLVVLAEGTR